MQANDDEMFYVRLFYWDLQAAYEEDEHGGRELFTNYHPDTFIYFHDSIMETLPFKRSTFDKHEIIKKRLADFGLDKEAFWNLIVYLYDYITDACKNLFAPQPSNRDILDELVKLTDGTEKLTSVTIVTESKKKMTITKPVILKGLDFEFDFTKLSNIERCGFDWQLNGKADKVDSVRKTSYFFAKQLVDFFGLERFDKIKRRQGASVSNKEKELILSLLYVCKFMDNEGSYLDTGYFNKLMKDYKDTRLNSSEKYTNIPLYFPPQ